MMRRQPRLSGRTGLLIAAVALTALTACTGSDDDQAVVPTTTSTTSSSSARTTTSPEPERPPGAFTNRQEPPSLEFTGGGILEFLVLVADDTASLDAHLADPDAMDDFLGWTVDPREPPRIGPHDTTWAGAVRLGRQHVYPIVPLPIEGASTGCSEHWMSVIDPEEGNEIIRLAPGICIGQQPEAIRPRLTESSTYLAVYSDWVAIDHVVLPHHYPVGQRDQPEWVAPEPAAILDRSTHQVPPGDSISILPEPDDRRSHWPTWPAGFEPSFRPASSDQERGPLWVSAARICLTVYIDAGDPGPDGTVTFDLDVRDADDRTLDAELTVPAEASPHTLTAFPLTPLPIREPTTITLHAGDGTIDTWAPAARGC